MNRISSLAIIILAVCFASGCGSDDTVTPAPSNLLLDSQVSSNGSGQVTFTASAQGATYYEFKFGDAPGASPLKVFGGGASHVYQESGTYTVTVTAFANADVSTTLSKDITVEVFISDAGYTTPESYAGMVSYWADEFNGDELNTSDWTYEHGDGCPNNCGWGNEELEYYTAQNTSVEDGYLLITARNESAGTRSYTSSRLITKGKKSIKYGRIDVRALLPKGQGIWPAIWLLGSNIDAVSWPKCGEIDIMEMIGGSGREKTVYGTAHFDDGGYKSSGGNYSLPSGLLSDQFHVYSIVWTATTITWFIDDHQYHSIDITAARAEFNEEFFFILNVAVGGKWPGAPDATLLFPQRMVVDYVRSFQTE